MNPETERLNQDLERRFPGLLHRSTQWDAAAEQYEAGHDPQESANSPELAGIKRMLIRPEEQAALDAHWAAHKAIYERHQTNGSGAGLQRVGQYRPPETGTASATADGHSRTGARGGGTQIGNARAGSGAGRRRAAHHALG